MNKLHTGAKFFYRMKCMEKLEADNEVCSRKGVETLKSSQSGLVEQISQNCVYVLDE